MHAKLATESMSNSLARTALSSRLNAHMHVAWFLDGVLACVLLARLRLRKQPGGSTLELTTGSPMNPHRKLGSENKQYKQNGYDWHHI